jgi:hypothetical protein
MERYTPAYTAECHLCGQTFDRQTSFWRHRHKPGACPGASAQAVSIDDTDPCPEDPRHDNRKADQ